MAGGHGTVFKRAADPPDAKLLRRFSQRTGHPGMEVRMLVSVQMADGDACLYQLFNLSDRFTLDFPGRHGSP